MPVFSGSYISNSMLMMSNMKFAPCLSSADM